ATRFRRARVRRTADTPDSALHADSPSPSPSPAIRLQRAPQPLRLQPPRARTCTSFQRTPSVRWRAEQQWRMLEHVLAPSLHAFRRLGAEQMAHEVVPALADEIGVRLEVMIAPGQQQIIEILVLPDHLVDESHRLRRV